MNFELNYTQKETSNSKLYSTQKSNNIKQFLIQNK